MLTEVKTGVQRIERRPPIHHGTLKPMLPPAPPDDTSAAPRDLSAVASAKVEGPGPQVELYKKCGPSVKIRAGGADLDREDARDAG